ncbi:MAG: hypothetical protein JWO12_1696, partial [Frankiales bacterium]|nr:hypothetical protein [Frankiales bacterium]
MALRSAAVDRERGLVALYQEAISGSPTLSARLAPLLADHESHLAALGGAPVGATTSRPAAAGTPAAVLARVAAAERTAAAAHA